VPHPQYVHVVRVPWSGASFLAYLGGFTVLFAALSLLAVQAEEHGDAGLVFWAAIVYAVLAALAYTALKTGHRVTAGLLAMATVVSFAVLVGAFLSWFGWWPEGTEPGFGELNFWLLVFELLTLAAAVAAWRLFRFPPLLFLVALAAWYFVTDLVSNGGDWSAIVTVFVGVVLFLAAGAADEEESPVRGFWLHVASGLAIGGGLLWFFNDGSVDWIIVGLAGLAYIAIGERLQRSSWIVLGAWGLFQTATFFADKWSDVVTDGFFPFGLLLFPFFLALEDFSGSDGHEWVGPLVYALLGLLYIGIALVLARRRRGSLVDAELI
jgi:hypothetical protein